MITWSWGLAGVVVLSFLIGGLTPLIHRTLINFAEHRLRRRSRAPGWVIGLTVLSAHVLSLGFFSAALIVLSARSHGHLAPIIVVAALVGVGVARWRMGELR
jgi:hypothetical protein